MPEQTTSPQPEDAPDRRPERLSDEAARIKEGIDTFGMPFVAFLTCEGVNHSAPDLLEQFTDRYLNWFPDRATFLEMELEVIGWAGELEAFREQEGIGDEYLGWNWDAIWRMSQRDYQFVERLGGVYAFWRRGSADE